MVLRVETPVAEAARWLPRLDMLTLLGTAIGVVMGPLAFGAPDPAERMRWLHTL